MARVVGVWTSPRKGSGTMDGHERAKAVAGHGFEGCAHARPGTKREVLFASGEHLDAVGVEHGSIRENVTVEGADVQGWVPGQRVAIGGALFEVTMECDPCSRMDDLRAGLQEELQGRRGVLARVLETGEVAVGDEVTLI